MLRRAKARLLYNRTQITLILLDVHGLKFSRHCDPANGGGSNLSNFQQKTIQRTARRIPSSRQRRDSERPCLF